MKKSRSAPFILCALLSYGCAFKDHPIARQNLERANAGQRGRGVALATLHEQFAFTHRIATTPGDPRHANEDPALFLGESLWFAGDREFARALSREPVVVRRSVAKYMAVEALSTKYPDTYSVLSKSR